MAQSLLDDLIRRAGGLPRPAAVPAAATGIGGRSTLESLILRSSGSAFRPLERTLSQGKNPTVVSNNMSSGNQPALRPATGFRRLSVRPLTPPSSAKRGPESTRPGKAAVPETASTPPQTPPPPMASPDPRQLWTSRSDPASPSAFRPSQPSESANLADSGAGGGSRNPVKQVSAVQAQQPHPEHAQVHTRPTLSGSSVRLGAETARLGASALSPAAGPRP
jgi:hypothetical protein